MSQSYYAVINNHYLTQVDAAYPLAVERYLSVLPGFKNVCVYGKKEECDPGFDNMIKKYEYAPFSVLKYQLAATVPADKVHYRPFKKVDKRVFKEEMKRSAYEQEIEYFKEQKQVVMEEKKDLEAQMQTLDKTLVEYDRCIELSQNIVNILTDMINKKTGATKEQ